MNAPFRLFLFLFDFITILHVSSTVKVSIPLQRSIARYQFGFSASQNDGRPSIPSKNPTERPVVSNGWPAYPGRQSWYLRMLQQKSQVKEQLVYWHLLFTAQIFIGSPPQPFIAVVDINWSDMFVPSSNCTLDPKSAPDCLPHRRYNSTRSSTYKANTTAANLTYQFLYSWGYLSQDVLHLAGLRVRNQVFEEATEWRSQYGNHWAPHDSVLGLARFRPRFVHSTVQAKSPLQNLVEQKLLDRNEFSLKLPRRDGEEGELVLGGFNRHYSVKSLLSLPLTNVTDEYPSFSRYASCGWQAEVSGMSLSAISKDQEPLSFTLEGFTAVFSNSFDFISVPWYISLKIMQYLGLDDELVDLPCAKRDELPNLTLSFGVNGEIVLTPWQYMIEVEHGQRCVMPFCSWMQTDAPGSPNWIILGTAFLSGVYSFFDLENKTLSLTIRDD